MAQTPPQIQRVIDGSYNFDFGKYIGDSLNVIGRNFGPFLGFMLVWFMISMATQFVPIIGPLASWLVVSPCLTAGVYLAVQKSHDKEYLDFGTFFKGFDHIGELALAALIQGLIMVAICIPAIIAFIVGLDFENFDPDQPDFTDFPWWALGFLIPVIYLSIAWAFTPMLIIFHKMQAWPAMEASRKIISKQWVMFFLLAIVAGIIATLGMLALIVGLLFTVPVYFAITYLAFRDIVGLPKEPEAATLASDHFVD
ncbi:MAG: hypothetical protein AAF597_07515 [Bacteroidota bacterium]